jgi:hypothetical protein
VSGWMLEVIAWKPYIYSVEVIHKPTCLRLLLHAQSVAVRLWSFALGNKQRHPHSLKLQSKKAIAL